jgi:hypothetical protein
MAKLMSVKLSNEKSSSTRGDKEESLGEHGPHREENIQSRQKREEDEKEREEETQSGGDERIDEEEESGEV